MAKFMFTLGLVALSGSAFSQSQHADEIPWPPEYEPTRSKFFVHNEIEIQARPETVWKFLIEALAWPSWYVGAENVSFKNPAMSVLMPNTVFYWKTMGLKFESTIRAFEPYRLLAWESQKKSIQGYHVWLIIPTETGCKVITDESQNGWLTFFEKTFQRNKLKKLHDIWLSELKRKAEDISRKEK